MHCAAQRQGDALVLALQGDWRLAGLDAARTELAALSLAGVRQVTVQAGDARIDVSGAWVLHEFLATAAGGGAKIGFEGHTPAALALIERPAEAARVPEDEHASAMPWLDPAVAVAGLGRRTVTAWELVSDTLDFLGRTAMAAANAFAVPRRWRPTSIARHVFDTGVTAIPIAALIAFLISVILAYMGAQQLRKFGADIFVVDLVTVGVLRELGVLLTAIIVAGRSGSAFAAELGAMRLNEEVDALSAIGVDPMEVLVLPRLLGLVIALPLLTVIADFIGLVGGGLLCHVLLDMPLVQYVNRANESIASTTFWVGMMKAPVFAVLIALSGTWCGMRVRGSSRDLGRMTTLAVVQSIFFVILADALFAMLFMELDI
jgi:phospholipid/cholesterol/gamma-HCH transport system permease protein